MTAPHTPETPPSDPSEAVPPGSPVPDVQAPATDGPDTAPPVPPAKPRRKLRPWQYILIGAAIPIVLFLAFVALLPLLLNALVPGGMPEDFGESTYEVSRMESSASVTLPGTIEPTQRLDLSFSSPGEVTRVHVTVGDTVTPGAVLATIDDTDLLAAVTDAQAEVDAAWKDYQDARAAGGSAAISAMRSAHAVKAQALKEAEEALEKATLTSTIDGVVASVNVQQGQMTGGGDAGSAPGAGDGSDGAVGADIVVISHTFQVKATVGGAERARLSKGLKAIVTSSSSQAPLDGTITALGVVAESTATADGRPGGASFPLVVTLDGQPTDVFAGASATIEILLDAGGEPALMIPEMALLERTSDTQGAVLRQEGEEQVLVPVTLGATNGDMIEVTSGLSEGDLIVFFGGMAGPPGSEVAIAEEPKR